MDDGQHGSKPPSSPYSNLAGVFSSHWASVMGPIRIGSADRELCNVRSHAARPMSGGLSRRVDQRQRRGSYAADLHTDLIRAIIVAMIIGDRLRDLREGMKLSQGDIEKRTGLLRCYISRVEN